jgi:hypothetical protein
LRHLVGTVSACLAIAGWAAGAGAQQDEEPPKDPEGKPLSTWGDSKRKSYLVPALEIAGFNYLLNLYDRNFQEEDVYRTHWDTIRKNLGRGWIIDKDPFATNQILHPYQGSLSHGFARSSGLGYWEALPYDLGGSALWEVAGETGPPSANDIITTTIGGSFLGEALFRMASLVLEKGGEDPGFGRELSAALISPPTGFNRLVFGDRFDGVFLSRDVPTLTRFGFGARRNAHLKDVDAVTDNISRDEIVANFAFSYGHPGKEGYEYARPFDYFQIEAAATTGSGSLPESVMTRGFLYGSTYKWGDDYRGIWGLYGVYDYISPDVFSVSSTALCFGTTGQWRLSKAVTGQGTILAGMGWSAVGTIADAEEDRDFHYGYSPQALLALRFIFDDVAMLDLSGRDYYIGRLGSHDDSVRENVLRTQVQLTVRVYGHHAVGVQFVSTVRNSSTFDIGGSLEAVGALGLFYTYIGDTDLGAVR